MVAKTYRSTPVPGAWLGLKRYERVRCHLNNGRPRYVVVWKVLDWEIQIMEIRYVGPHGSADYSRFK